MFRRTVPNVFRTVGLLAWMAGCSSEPIPVSVGDWPSSGCQSGHVPVAGSVLTRWESHRLSTPDDVELAVGLITPVTEGCWPAVLYVPEGFSGGLAEWDESSTTLIAGAGVVVGVFDPRGRGESGGTSDYVGPEEQDDTAAVLAWLASRPEVDPERTFVRSRSLGIVLTVGALFRNPELAPAGVIDIEGPGVLPDDLDHASEQARERWAELAEGEGDSFWEERSPAQRMGSVRASYRRIQAIEDHQLGPYMGGAQAMLEAASTGQAARVDLNGWVPDDAVETHSTQDVVWPYPMVQELALEGRVKYDDERALDLILDALRR